MWISRPKSINRIYLLYVNLQFFRQIQLLTIKQTENDKRFTYQSHYKTKYKSRTSLNTKLSISLEFPQNTKQERSGKKAEYIIIDFHLPWAEDLQGSRCAGRASHRPPAAVAVVAVAVVVVVVAAAVAAAKTRNKVNISGWIRCSKSFIK